MHKAAAIYARVSSDRQKENHTIASQTAALLDHAATNGYSVPPEWVFQDEGYSGAVLARPGLEALRDLAAEGQIGAGPIYYPDRLSRKYAYQVLLAEEFSRCGVELILLKSPAGHEEIFQRFPTENYWTCYQCEWATDVVFRRAEFLKRLMKVLVPHGMLSFSSTDVLRYFGKRVTKAGEIPERFNGELQTNLKQYREGERVKFRLQGNALKFYDKAYTELGSVLRAAETTINNVAVFQSYRAKQGGPSDQLKWRRMRKGVADLHSRAEVSQRVNNRLMNAFASVDDSRRLEELMADLQQPTYWNKRRVRALRPFADDHPLLAVINRGDFLLNGFRN